MKHLNTFLFTLLLGCILCLQNGRAQDANPVSNPANTPAAEQNEPERGNKQLYLDKPAQAIKSIQYKEGGEPIKGELAKDGKRVFLYSYTRRARVVVEVQYADGTSENIERSPCFIDPAEEM